MLDLLNWNFALSGFNVELYWLQTWYQSFVAGSPHSIEANILDCDVIISEFKLIHLHFPFKLIHLRKIGTQTISSEDVPLV